MDRVQHMKNNRFDYWSPLIHNINFIPIWT
jgi:hypothetical protein